MLPFAVADTNHGPGWIASVPRINRFSQAIRQWGLSNLYERTSLLEGLAAGAILLAFVTLAIRRSGDPRTRSGARMAGAVAGFVWLAPLVLSVLGQDYFLGRNVIPAFIPVVSVIAAACLEPRVRLLGGTLAALLLTVFSLATAWVQTHPYLERPNWRSVAHALAGAPVPRAILVANGATADALKIYLPRVSWTAPAELWVREVDVVGTIKRLRLARQAQPAIGAGPRAKPWRWGRPLPVRSAPPNTVLLARFRVHNWILARFALRHPIRVSPDQLRQLAPRFFLHTPRTLLVLFQPPGR
jgi:multisubunit Na+/H+ antiporter MnhB subunit